MFENRRECRIQSRRPVEYSSSIRKKTSRTNKLHLRTIQGRNHQKTLPLTPWFYVFLVAPVICTQTSNALRELLSNLMLSGFYLFVPFWGRKVKCSDKKSVAESQRMQHNVKRPSLSWKRHEKYRLLPMEINKCLPALQ